MRGRRPIAVEDYSSIVVLSGAGISVASGIRPYRGPGGLWNDESLVKFADIASFHEDPLAVWRFWWKTRESVLAARPNPAHEALADFEAGWAAGEPGAIAGGFTLITQNIDGLHRRAGSRNLVEYHGNVLYTRCSNPGCALESYVDGCIEGETPPLCPRCGSLLRPDIVMFGENIPPAKHMAAEDALANCDLFIAVGTSGTVYPASGFVSLAKEVGARTALINLETIRAGDGVSDFDEEILGRAEELLPLIFGREAAEP